MCYLRNLIFVLNNLGPVLSSDTAAVNTITENLEISMDTSELTAVPDAEADEINVKLEGHSSQSTLAERGDESRTVDEVEYEPPKPSKYTKLRRHGFIDKRSDISKYWDSVVRSYQL